MWMQMWMWMQMQMQMQMHCASKPWQALAGWPGESRHPYRAAPRTSLGVSRMKTSSLLSISRTRLPPLPTSSTSTEPASSLSCISLTVPPTTFGGGEDDAATGRLTLGKHAMNFSDSWPCTSRCCTSSPHSFSSSSMVLYAATFCTSAVLSSPSQKKRSHSYS